MTLQMYDNGFIVLHRSILNWDWYGDKNTTRLFIHLILTANYIPGEWHGRHIKVGQRITSLTKLSQEISLSIKEIRTCLKHLQQTGEVACESTNQYTVITIKNYERYQSRASSTARERADNRASSGHGKGKRRASEGQQYNKATKEQGNKYTIGASGASPLTGERVPAIGDGECSLEINGECHRFPKSWYKLAEEKGWEIEQYVRWRNQ